MNVLIVEDETAAYENLVDIIYENDPSIQVIGNTESIEQTVKWLQSNPLPDLIFMDIHLSDGSAFSIFNAIEVEVPIVFTTAYDEYAIDAFKVNSIDYLLKPIKADELNRSLQKFNKWARTDVAEYLMRLTQLSPARKKYKDRLLIPINDKLIPLDMCEISCFYTSDKITRIFLKNKQSYVYSKTLEHIMTTLDPACFYRANKQFIVSRNSVKNITIWFDSRLLLTLDIESPERIYVSKNRASAFKEWFVND